MFSRSDSTHVCCISPAAVSQRSGLPVFPLLPTGRIFFFCLPLTYVHSLLCVCGNPTPQPIVAHRLISDIFSLVLSVVADHGLLSQGTKKGLVFWSFPVLYCRETSYSFFKGILRVFFQCHEGSFFFRPRVMFCWKAIAFVIPLTFVTDSARLSPIFRGVRAIFHPVHLDRNFSEQTNCLGGTAFL